MQDSDYISYINVHSKNNRMLKAEFHTHVKGDPQDNISYSAKQLVDKAAELNYDVLAITCHNWVYEDQSIEEYAKNKNIILFRGIERDIENKHTLLYNITNDEAQKIFTFTDLKKAKEKNPDIFVIAPHPFMFTKTCLKNKIIKHFKLFDAWEISFFTLSFFDFNRKTKRLAKKFNKPLVGNSDVHRLKDLGRAYTLIDAKKDRDEIFKAIKNNKIKVIENPLKLKEFLSIIFNVTKHLFKK